MEMFFLFASAVAVVAYAVCAQAESRKWKKLATKMQNMAVKEQEKREKAETETQWWRERAEIVKAERDRLRHFETECLAKSRALEEREKELAGERDSQEAFHEELIPPGAGAGALRARDGF